MFFSKHDYENYLNVLIELWTNPGLVILSVKPGHNVLGTSMAPIRCNRPLTFVYNYLLTYLCSVF